MRPKKLSVKMMNRISIVVTVVVILAGVYIMANQLGLVDSLDFGAGAYYYADIPEFQKYLAWDAFKEGLPYWVYVVLFLVWGALMYLLWLWIDKRK